MLRTPLKDIRILIVIGVRLGRSEKSLREGLRGTRKARMHRKRCGTDGHGYLCFRQGTCPQGNNLFVVDAFDASRLRRFAKKSVFIRVAFAEGAKRIRALSVFPLSFYWRPTGAGLAFFAAGFIVVGAPCSRASDMTSAQLAFLA